MTLGLIQNIAILLAFSMMYDYIWSQFEKPISLPLKVFSGLAIGVFGVILIMTPWRMAPGVIFDVRSILLSISGLFFGLTPTIVAAIITGAYRIYLGGEGTIMGIAVILLSSTIGLLWRLKRPTWQSKNAALELLVMGFAVHLLMLACTIFLPSDLKLHTLQTILLPVLTLYPLTTMLLGLLMIYYHKNWRVRKDIITNEKRFRTIIEKATDAMYLLDYGGNILDTNEQACKMLGYTREELLKLKLFDIDDLQQDTEKMLAVFRRIKREGSLIFESIHRRKDGGTIPVEINSSPIELNGEFFIIGFARNITERKQVEESLNLSKDLFRSIFENNQTAIAIIEEDKTFSMVNDAFCEMTGYPRQEVIGTSVAKFIHDDDLERLAEYNTKRLINKDMPKGYEFKVYDKNQSIKHALASISLIESNRKIVASFTDITDRIMAERAFQESEEKHRILLDESPDPIFSFTPQGKYIYANKAFAEGVNKTIDQIIGKRIWDVFSNEEAEKRFAAVSHVFSTGEEKIIEVKVPRSDNDRYYLTTITPIKDTTGKVISAICSSKNITERKKAEELITKLNEELEHKVLERTKELARRSTELAQNEEALLNLVEDLNEKSEELKRMASNLQLANNELEAFAYSVSHDLRAPLRAIEGFTQILVESSSHSLDDEGKRLTSIITENTQRMGQLIDDLLSFSRVGRSDLNFSNFSFNKLIETAYQEVTIPSDRKRINFRLEPLPVVFADHSLMKQVWVNLISNAVKFCSKAKHPEIAIDYNESDEYFTFFIEDNGVGFDMRYYSRLFGVFQRLHSVKQFEGTGVGLAIAQRIVQRHKGKIWAESEIDKGAKFFFTLPKVDVNSM